MSDNQYMPPLEPDEAAEIENVKRAIKDFMSDIAGDEQVILEMQEAIRQTKNAVSSLIASVLGDIPAKHVKNMATVLYWTYDEPYIRRGIAEGLGLKSNVALGNRVYAAFYELTCECGAQYRHPLQSVSQKSYRAPDKCESCREKQAEADKQRIQADREAYAKARHELKTMPYSEYLKTDHWQELRKRALKRSQYRCQTCNAQGVLHVHHRTYIRRGEEQMSDLIVLCAGCHETFHNVHEVNNE